MRSLPQPYQQSPSTWMKSEDRPVTPSTPKKRLSVLYCGARPSTSDIRSFDLFDNKAEVTILNNAADDDLAAAIYGSAKRSSKKKKSKKQKKPKKPKMGVSGYDFDALLKEDSSSFSSSEHY